MLQLWKEGRLVGDLKHLLAGLGGLQEHTDQQRFEENLSEKKLNGVQQENGGDSFRGSVVRPNLTNGDKVGQLSAMKTMDQVDQPNKTEKKKFKIKCCSVM